MKRITMAAIALGLACASASWAQGLQPSKDACAYSVPELETALGIKLQAGRGSEVGFAGGKQLSCSYSGKGLHSVTLTQVRMDNAASLAADFDRFKAGTMEPIVGDTDKDEQTRPEMQHKHDQWSYEHQKCRHQLNLRNLRNELAER